MLEALDQAELGRPMSEFGAEHGKLEKVRDHAQVSRRFPLQKERGRSLSKASTRAYVSSSPSLARPFVINSSSGMRITQLGGLPRKGLRRHRPEDHLSHVPSIRHVHGLEGVGPRCRTQHWEQPGHASACPFEALAKRALWLGVPSEFSCFGRAMLATGCI